LGIVVNVLRGLAAVAGVVLVALGVAFWTGNDLQLVRLHELAGYVLVASMWALALLAQVAGSGPGPAVLAVLCGLLMPVLGPGPGPPAAWRRALDRPGPAPAGRPGRGRHRAEPCQGGGALTMGFDVAVGTRPSDEGREDLHVGHHKVDRAGGGGAGRSARGDRGPGEGDRGYTLAHTLVLVTGGRLRIAGLWCVVIGDGRNLEDVRRAMSEQDAVISTVAQGSRRQPVHRDPRHPDRGRRDEGVRRMPAGLCQRLSSGSAGIPPWSASCAGSSRVSYADRAVAERLVQPSGLDWTIVRPTTTSISATSDTSGWPK
jgi:NAD(P)H-binding